MTKLILILALFLSATPAFSDSRFFYQGKGNIKTADKAKLKNLSPRLLALLSYLQEQLSHGKGAIKILSAYRSPEYNEGLRKQGKLAGKASMHLEGMAVDFSMKGVSAKEMWQYVRKMNCCGVGYYHGDAVHLDTGPARFWDERSSKVFTDISSNNKQIYAVTNYDIYHPGETLVFQLVRMTAIPFGVKSEVKIMKDKKEWKKANLDGKKDCLIIEDREAAQHFEIPLPQETTSNGERLSLEISFCQKPAEEMPSSILSNPFIIEAPRQ